jgi:DNA-binding response OmpR family regulator
MGNSRSVLVVDDHPATVELVKSALESLGMDVRTASNGAECLLAMEEEAPDLVMLDVMMPVMDGFQTLQVLQQSPEKREVPVIMLTARSDDADIAYGWRWGVTSYLTKPFSVEHLVALVRRVLDEAVTVAAEDARRKQT